MDKTYDWIPFYEELADKLLEYKNNRSELFQIIKNLAPQNEKLEYLHFERDDWRGSRNYEIDPFSIFATFNRQLTDKNRISIAKLISKQFNISANIPTDFTGIPVRNAQKSFFGGVNEIWELFEEAINCAKSENYTDNFKNAFDKAINAHGNALATITMGLFWIRPSTYLNLDSQNKSFISNKHNNLSSLLEIFPDLVKKTPSGAQYIEMCIKCKQLIDSGNYEFKTLPQMSHVAFRSNDNDEVKNLVNIVCLYYSRLHSNDMEYKENCTKILELISSLTGIKYNTLRQNKDSFDPSFDNGRQGFHQKPLEKQNKALYATYLAHKDTPIEELKSLVEDIIEKIENQEFNESKISNANFLKWFAPLILALKDLGSSATPNEARQQIMQNEKLSVDIVNEVREKNSVNKFSNELAFARNYLVYDGIIEKGTHGRWKLTQKGLEVIMTDELASEIFSKWVKINNQKLKTEGVLHVKKCYWLCAAGRQAKVWNEFYNDSIIGIGWENLGDLSAYNSREEIKEALQNDSNSENSFVFSSLATWQFANEMQIGDIVYVKKGLYKILGRGMVESDYIYDEVREKYKHIRKVNWTHKGRWEHPGQAVQKTLTNITQYTEYVEKLEALFEVEPYDSVVEYYDEYTKNDFLSDVFMSEENYTTLSNLLKRKKNIILQGAPGVGKTYAALRLAFSLLEIKDTSRVQLIQFHQSYSYEDFIMGYRPHKDGFKLHKGVFYDFCKKAQDDDKNDYYFLIDEINRGNLSKIFGELFMLIEHDKRDKHNSMRLLYSNEQFYIPSNVHIIGMMNTADRSLAMLDYALRRRFAFFEMTPAFDSDGFISYQENNANDKFDKLISQIKQLNSQIKSDESLGAGFRIGHSYFITDEIIDDIWLNSVVNYEIIPLLREYWFDESGKIVKWTDALRDAIL